MVSGLSVSKADSFNVKQFLYYTWLYRSSIGGTLSRRSPREREQVRAEDSALKMCFSKIQQRTPQL